MNTADQLLLESAEQKIKACVAHTMSAAEREAYSYFHGPQRLEAVLTTKAATPAVPPAPQPSPTQTYSRKEIRQLFEASNSAVLTALRTRDEQITVLRDRVSALSDRLLLVEADHAAAAGVRRDD